MTHEDTKTILVMATLPDSLLNFRGQLLAELVARGYRVVAAAARVDAISRLSGQEIAGRLAAMGVIYRPVPLERTGVNPLKDLRAFFALLRLCRQYRPDITLAYTAKAIVYGTLAARLTGARKRFALVAGLGYGVTGHGIVKQDFTRRVANILFRAALRCATGALFQNPDDQQAVLESGLLRKGMPTTIVNGSGVDINHFAVVPLPEGPFTFLLIARLLVEKGIYEYVEAARLIKHDDLAAQFLLVGPLDNHYDGICEETVRGWEEEGVLHWLGLSADVREPIARCHVYVLPSYHEGTPRTVLEAMAMGRAIITTDAPGCRETVIEGVNGCLVPVKDAPALAQTMRRFIDDPSLAARMGYESRRIAEEKYDVRKVNNAIIAFIEGAAEGMTHAETPL